ncbi:tetratricopeptide repeat protein [uncultured Nostoc sp.]|uniref:tetratricopeptide repeat protein n=1 Tax=uncultured Nostoc sp. TaxID=340711 RepID=UPI0035CC45F6
MRKSYSSTRIYHHLGIVAQHLREYDQVRDYYQQALEIKIEFGDRYSCASTYYQLGKVAEELGELEEAKANYLQDLVITTKFNDEHGLGISLRNLARFYQTTQDEDLLREVAKIFQTTVEELKEAIINSEE